MRQQRDLLTGSENSLSVRRDDRAAVGDFGANQDNAAAVIGLRQKR